MADDPIQTSDPTTVAANDAGAASDAGATPADPQAPQKSPLDILEELLKDSKKGADGGAGDASGSDAASTSSAETPPPATGEMTPEERAALDAKIAEQAAKDQQVMQQTLQGLESVKTSPQYQAKVEQETKQAEEKQHEDEEHDGHQIRQLGHTTI